MTTTTNTTEKVSPYVRREASDRQVPYADFHTKKDGYERWQQAAGADYSAAKVYVHRLLAVAKYGFDAVAGKHVHHKNNVRWDNRPDNIELLGAGEHQREAVHYTPSGEDHHKFVPEEELLADLRAGAAVLGRPPRSTDIENWGEYSKSAYRSRWGGWKNVLLAADLNPTELPEYEDGGSE